MSMTPAEAFYCEKCKPDQVEMRPIEWLNVPAALRMEEVEGSMVPYQCTRVAGHIHFARVPDAELAKIRADFPG